MGLIDKALKFGLSKMPPLTTGLKKVPLLTTLNWAIKSAKWGYEKGTQFDQKTHSSDKLAKWGFDKTGGASKGLIAKADRAEQLYKKGKGYYDQGKGLVDKGMKWGEQKLEKAIKRMVGADKSLPQNPTGSKLQSNKVAPSHRTPFPKTTLAPNKTSTLNLPDIPNFHLRKPKLGRSLHLKSYKNAISLGNKKAHVNLRALANHKLFTIKPAGSNLKFNAAKNKTFTIKPKASLMPKLNTQKLKTPSISSKPAYKFPSTNKAVFKSPAIPRPARSSSISKSIMKSPFKK